MAFVFKNDDERMTNIDLEERYSSNQTNDQLSLVERIKHEKKFSEYQQHEVMRFNFVNNLFETIDQMPLEGDEDEERSLGEELAYNTMFHYGFIKKVKN